MLQIIGKKIVSPDHFHHHHYEQEGWAGHIAFQSVACLLCCSQQEDFHFLHCPTLPAKTYLTLAKDYIKDIIIENEVHFHGFHGNIKKRRGNRVGKDVTMIFF